SAQLQRCPGADGGLVGCRAASEGRRALGGQVQHGGRRQLVTPVDRSAWKPPSVPWFRWPPSWWSAVGGRGARRLGSERGSALGGQVQHGGRRQLVTPVDRSAWKPPSAPWSRWPPLSWSAVGGRCARR